MQAQKIKNKIIKEKQIKVLTNHKENGSINSSKEKKIKTKTKTNQKRKGA